MHITVAIIYVSLADFSPTPISQGHLDLQLQPLASLLKPALSCMKALVCMKGQGLCSLVQGQGHCS